ncbi:MAG: transposase [Planctomycetes bacterium]|nr:transposase [Planctomycetota bacterium]
MKNWKVIYEAHFGKDPQYKKELCFQIIDFLEAQSRILGRIYKSKGELTNQDRKELAIKARKVGRKIIKDISHIAKVDTLWTWHKKLVLGETYKKRKEDGPGRPRTDQTLEDLIVSMAILNISWGYKRIKGELQNVGITISKTAIRNILFRYGIEPAPDRESRENYEKFFKDNINETWATDFFTAETFNAKTNEWVYYYVLFFIHHAAKRVVIAGMTEHPTGAWVLTRYDWMLNQARGWANIEELFDNDKYLIHDRDTKYTEAFKDFVEARGIECITSFHPNMNPIAERFVKSIKNELLSRKIYSDERKLMSAMREYQNHFNTERPHQGLDNTTPFPASDKSSTGTVTFMSRQGGVLSHYYRESDAA